MTTSPLRSQSLIHQAPPGVNLTRASSPPPPREEYTPSPDPDPGPDHGKAVFAGVGLVIALGAAGAGIWISNHVKVPDVPPEQVQTAPQQHQEPIHQPMLPPAPAVQTQTPAPRPAEPRQSTPLTPVQNSTTVNSDGVVTVPLGHGVSVDTEGRTSVQLGNTSIRSDGTTDVQLGNRVDLRSDGTTGFRLNNNMTLRSDGTVEWHFGGH